MIIRENGKTSLGAGMLAIATGFGALLLAATPAGALGDTQQLLAGGNSMGEGATQYTSPGFANQFGIDFPGTGLGEKAVQLRMPAGVLSTLRVKLTTQTTPVSGVFSVMVRKNGADTVLTCQLMATGACTALVNVTIANNDRLAVRISNSFTGSGVMGYSYTLLFD